MTGRPRRSPGRYAGSVTVYALVIDLARREFPKGLTSRELRILAGNPLNCSGAICMAAKRGNLIRIDGRYYFNADGPLGSTPTDADIVAFAPQATSIYDLATRLRIGRPRARAALRAAGITAIGRPRRRV